jgi:hypothetical protein
MKLSWGKADKRNNLSYLEAQGTEDKNQLKK